MKLSLIITTYNWPEALFLVLKSINNQTILPNEVIVADDGSQNETRKLIEMINESFDFEVNHFWQEDLGFRASRVRNNAIKRANGNYIVLIDGDTILHHDFVKDHIRNAEPGFFVQGGRVLLSKTETQNAIKKQLINFLFFGADMMNRKNSIHSNLLSMIFSSKKNHHKGVKSCNMAFYKTDCEKINGFNNDFEGWGREDSEFVIRLMNSGIHRKNIRFNSIQYHMWHNENSKASLEKNNLILKNSIEKKLVCCENGISQL